MANTKKNTNNKKPGRFKKFSESRKTKKLEKNKKREEKKQEKEKKKQEKDKKKQEKIKGKTNELTKKLDDPDKLFHKKLFESVKTDFEKKYEQDKKGKLEKKQNVKKPVSASDGPKEEIMLGDKIITPKKSLSFLFICLFCSMFAYSITPESQR